MTTLGEAVTAILVEIVNSTAGTTVVIAKNLLVIFNILTANAGASPLSLLMGASILTVMVFALLKFLKGEAKIMIIALIILSSIALLIVML